MPPTPTPAFDPSHGYIAGIDEAGRGPVLGSMVYGIAWCPVDLATTMLPAIGFADSKQLTAEQRELLYAAIQANQQWLGSHSIALTPQELSSSMQKRHPYSLNSISYDTAISLIHHLLNQGLYMKHIYIDTVGDPTYYQKRLTELFPQVEEFTVRSKADSLYPIVSAASIVAKVRRDQSLKDWKYQEKFVQPHEQLQQSAKANKRQKLQQVSTTAPTRLPAPSPPPHHPSGQLGSGYPHDPDTKQWLLNNSDRVFGFPALVRFSWQTTKNLCEERCCYVDWGDGGDDLDAEEKENQVADIPKLTSYFAAKPVEQVNPLKQRAAVKRGVKYFDDLRMQHVTTFRSH